MHHKKKKNTKRHKRGTPKQKIYYKENKKYKKGPPKQKMYHKENHKENRNTKRQHQNKNKTETKNGTPLFYLLRSFVSDSAGLG